MCRRKAREAAAEHDCVVSLQNRTGASVAIDVPPRFSLFGPA